VNLLLDTHALLWWLADSDELGDAARAAIRDPASAIYFSAVNVWEIAIKKALGKLVVPDDFRETLNEQPFDRLPMSVDHAFKVSELPMHHRDPFDRLLIAQSLVEGLTLVTHDSDIAKYDVPLLLT
jgi:PIN domain nuclease of toxin-antitoxin system